MEFLARFLRRSISTKLVIFPLDGFLNLRQEGCMSANLSGFTSKPKYSGREILSFIGMIYRPASLANPEAPCMTGRAQYTIVRDLEGERSTRRVTHGYRTDGFILDH